jgi:hypothetical protein
MQLAAKRGTEIHAFAAEAIRLKIPLQENGTTVSLYVNDAIRYLMRAEQMLVWSENVFGQADAIGYRKKILRIFDLKTGSALTSKEQLQIYAALFCLEYSVDPFDTEFDLRIYQNDAIKYFETDGTTIKARMERIKYLDRRVAALREEADE